MRQIEQDIVNAARFGVSFHAGTSSSYHPENTGYRDNLSFNGSRFSYKLWGNEIATGDTQTEEITVSDCGYPTATTVSRLNALFAGLDIPAAASIKKGKVIYKVHGSPVEPGMFHYYADDWHVTIK